MKNSTYCLHHKYCFIIWSAWLFEILLIIIYKVANISLIFTAIVVPLNRMLATFAFMPIEPVLFVVEIIDLKKKKAIGKLYFKAILFFALNTLFWCIYMFLFIWINVQVNP